MNVNTRTHFWSWFPFVADSVSPSYSLTVGNKKPWSLTEYIFKYAIRFLNGVPHSDSLVRVNLPNCGSDIREGSLLAVSVFHVRVQVGQGINVGRSNQQRSLLSRSEGWRPGRVIFIFLSSSTQTSPLRGFLSGGCPPSSLIALPQPNKVVRLFLTNVWRSSFMLSPSCVWREAPLT